MKTQRVKTEDGRQLTIRLPICPKCGQYMNVVFPEPDYTDGWITCRSCNNMIGIELLEIEPIGKLRRKPAEV